MDGSAALFDPLVESAPAGVRPIAAGYPPGERNSYSNNQIDEARTLLPSLRVADIPGPHLGLVTNPHQSWAAITRFMDEVEAT